MPTPHHHHHRRHADPPPISVPPKPNQKLLSLLLKSIIMGLIISLFLLFLGVAAIVFLHFLLIGSFLHRRRHRSSSSPTPTSSAFSPDQLQTNLPPFKYNNSRFITSKDCSICLECFKEGEICRTLPVCGHVFHAGCVDQWLTRVPNCPVCRTRVRLSAGDAPDSSISDDDNFKLFWTFGV